MRRKHIDILKKKLVKGDFRWFIDQSRRFLSVPLSYYLKRTLTTPLLGGIVATYRCNERCPMCELTRKANMKQQEISTDEFLNIIDQFAEIQVAGVSITGGEPLLRKDIFDVIRRLKSHQIPVSMSTNGLLLRKKDIAEELLTSGIDSFAISVDGATPEEHDFSRGQTGAFEKTLAGIENVLRLRNELGFNDRVYITIATVINNRNYCDFEQLLQLAQNLGVDNVSLNPVHKISKDFLEEKGDLYFKEYTQDVEELTRVLLELKKKYQIIDSSTAYINLLPDFFQHKPLPIRCYAPYMALYVDCYKNIFPCGGYFYESKPIFNLDNKTLKDVWASPQYEYERQKLRGCRACYFSCMAELSLTYAKLP